MERIGCWPDANTFDALLRVTLRAAEIGTARVGSGEQFLRHMTTTIHHEFPAAGGYEHATAMLGAISFPEMKRPVGVARTAIPVRESHVCALLHIVAHEVRWLGAGLADVDRIIGKFGAKQLGRLLLRSMLWPWPSCIQRGRAMRGRGMSRPGGR